MFTEKASADQHETILRRWTWMEERIRSELVNGFLHILEDRLVKIVLYGSVARGRDTEGSDIDIALVMYGKLDADTEDRLSDFVVDMNLKYDKVFSVIDIDAEHFRTWMDVLPFYQNVEKEGIVLWKAA